MRTAIAGRLSKLGLGILAACAVMAGAGEALAQSECTLTSANIPSLSVMAGATVDTTVLDTATAATLTYMNANCGAAGNNAFFFETVEGSRDIAVGQVVTLISGSTIQFGSAPRRIIYRPGPGVTGTEQISFATAQSGFATSSGAYDLSGDRVQFYRNGSNLGEFYTVIVTIVAPNAPTAELTTLSPSTIYGGGTSTVTVTLTNPNASAPLAGVGDVMSLPSGVTVAGTPGASTTCSGGTVTAAVGAGAVSLSGGSLAANGNCTMTFNVTSSTVATYPIPSGTPSATGANAGSAGTTQTLTVTAPPAAPTITAAWDEPNVAVGVTGRKLTVTVTNPNAVTLTGVGFNAGTLASSFNVTNLSGTCLGTSYNGGTRQLAMTGFPMAAGASCTATLDFTVTTRGAYTFTTGAAFATGPVALAGGTATTGALTVWSPPTVAVAATSPVALNAPSTVTLTYTNANAGALTGVGTTAAVSLPANVVIHSTPGATSACGGTVTAAAGAGTFAVSDLTVPGGGVCAVSFNVTSATVSTYAIPTGTPTSTQGGVGVAGATASLQVVVAAPTVTSIAPTAGPASGGATVTITGTNFTGATAVAFGATAATGFTVNSATQITATAPAGTGTVDVRVTTVGGTSATSAADQYTYVGAPTVTAISPTAGPATGGTSVVVTGTNFSGTTAVTFGATAATGFTVNSATQITATAPAGTGTVDVRVTTVGGTSATSAADQYTYVGAPTVTAISPTAGPATGGATVVVTGTNFSGSTAVTFGATAATGFTVNSATQITATAPAGTGTVDIRITTLGGTSATSAADQFTYVGAPTVTAISPTAGPATGGTTVTITGTNFPGATAVTFGATAATGFTVNSASQITATAPAGTGTVDVRVTTLGGTSATSAADQFTFIAAPTAADVVGYAVAYETATPIDLSASITGVHSSIAIGTAPANGTTSVAGDVVTYTPTAGYYGADSFTYSATGPGGTSAPATVTLTVATPGAPFAANLSGVAVGYDSTGTAIDLSTSITGVHGSLAVATAPAHGATSFAGDVVTYTPTAGYFGADSFTYSATGPGGTSAPATVTLTVATPGAPFAANLSGVAVGYDSTGTAIDLSASITGVHRSIAIGTAPANGTTSVAGDVVTYTPPAGYYGADSFTYTATGPGGTSAPATVSLTVATPGTPLAANLAGVAVGYDSTGTAIDLSASVTGVHSSLAIGTAPAHGTTSVAGDVVTYTPTAGYYGGDSFIYAATGPGGTSAPATVSLTVATPGAPVAAAASANVPYDTATAIDLSTSITGVHGSLAVATAPAHGATSVAGDVVTYTPTAGYYGADSFTYTATGPGGASAPATVSLTVATPGAPAAADLTGVAVGYNSTGAAIDLSASVTGVHGSLAVGTAPAHGTASAAGDVVTYIPTAGYSGADSFTYTATGPGGTSAPATVTLTVATPPPPVIEPPAPIVVPPPAGDGSSAPIIVNLGEQTDGEVDGFRITAAPQFGAAEIASSAASRSARAVSVQAVTTYQLIYTPPVGFMGTDTVTLVAFGPGGDSTPVTFTFQVAGKAPDLTGQAPSDDSATFTPTAGLTGGPFKGLRITRNPDFGTAEVQGLTIVFTPGATNGGATSLDYVIELPFGDSAAGRIALASNLVPVAQTLEAQTLQGVPVTVRISDAPGGPFTAAAVTLVSPSSAGAATIAGAGSAWDLTFTPAGTFLGPVVVTYSLSNPFGTATSTLTATVEARPDPSLDPDVRGVASSQVSSARRFADAQIGNVSRRLQDLHDGDNAWSNGLSLNFGSLDQAGADPREALRRQMGLTEADDPRTLGDDRFRAMRERDARGGEASVADVASTGRLGAASGAAGGDDGRLPIGVWVAGSIDWGRQDAEGRRDDRFTTQGVTGGMDMRISDQLIVGAALGYGEDKTRIGDAGTETTGEGITGAIYASWRPAEALYLDGMLGYTGLDYASRRWTAGLAGQPDSYATGERSGDVRFASAAFGRVAKGRTRTTDLYARLDARSIALDGFVETGAGLASLAWDAVDQTSLSANLGATVRWRLNTRRIGLITPSLRVEWSHEFEDVGDQGVRYADWAASPTYLVPMDAWSRDTLRLDLGTDWSLTDRLMLGLGYRGSFGDASQSHGLEARVKVGW